MDSSEMKRRTKSFSMNVAVTMQKIPDNLINRVYKTQLVRSATSVGANYRAARRAKSTADFINKLKIVEEELDECLFFLELLQEFNPTFSNDLSILYQEGETLLKIIVTTLRTSRG